MFFLQIICIHYFTIIYYIFILINLNLLLFTQILHDSTIPNLEFQVFLILTYLNPFSLTFILTIIYIIIPIFL